MLKAFAFVTVMLLFAAEARAQEVQASEPTYEQKVEAAKLADEGLVLFQGNDFAGAVVKFEAAEKIVPAPTIMLQHGRALERLGRWVEAVGKYRAVADAEIKPTTPWQQRNAKAEGARELDRLGPRVPKIRIVVTPPGAPPALQVDGRDVEIPLTGELVLDPGEHVIEGRRKDGSQARRSIVAAADKTTTLELELTQPRAAGADEAPGMHPIALAGWIGVGVSGLCLLAAVGTGVPALVLKGGLSDKCPSRQCAPSEHGDVETYDALRWTAGVTLISGALIAGGAVAAIMLAPKPADAQTGVPTISVGPGSARLEWRFF
ncbi:MAG: hypothetical protein JNL21_18970 [Myxococcales bacterium]|nr:hypothetical protein [Myxococcales bacterium]